MMTSSMHGKRLSAASAVFAGLAVVGLVVCGAVALAADYPQWRGVHRDGLSADTGLLKSWPASGPTLAWSVSGMGEGHASVSVAKGRIYGMGLRGQDEVVWALDEKTGKEAWSKRIAPGIRLNGGQGGYGPRCTPTVDGSRVYVIGVGGEMACLDAASGNIVWQKSFTKDFQAEVPTWGFSESPLVDGDLVIGAPGGRKATVVAFNKNSGEVAWMCQTNSDSAHYSSAIAADVDGQREIIHFLSDGVVGVSAKDGKLLWRYDAPANHTANCSTPIFHDNMVFAASGYSTGGGLVKLGSSGGGTTATPVYFTKEMQNHHGGMVLVGDYLYGFDQGTLRCLEFKTGKVMWSDRSVGKGSVCYADGMLIARAERGTIGLVEATPTGYVEKGRFEQPDRSGAAAWPYPVVANGKLYIRDMDKLLCYNLKAPTAQR